VKLSLLLLPYHDDNAVRVTRLDQPDTIVSFGTPPNPCAATRRAIVRAAAEIGRNVTAEKKAPWPDFKGQDIHEGDMIEHPSGERGTVVFLAIEKEPSDQWRVDYGGSVHSRLCLQIGDKGRAVVARNV
jgi:hypothetical protein